MHHLPHVFSVVFLCMGPSSQARELEEQKKAEQQERMLRANPLLMNQGGSEGGDVAPLKRRWDDEVVFKNQAKNLPAPKKQ